MVVIYLQIDFHLLLCRCQVCEVQSPTMLRREQTVPLSWICRHQLTGCSRWICFHTGLKSRLLFSWLNLTCLQHLFIFSCKGFCLCELCGLFLSFLFILVSCFSIKSHLLASPSTPVPHWPIVCFDYVLSRSCQGTLSVSVSAQTYSMPEKCVC